MTTAMEHVPSTAADVLLDGFLQLVTPAGFRAELIEGEIVVSPPPDGKHEKGIWRIVRQVAARSATEMDFSGHKGLRLERGGQCPKNYAIPDGVFVPAELDLFEDADSWMPCNEVALAIEVTSSQPDRDRVVKRYCYARAGIPLYLLVDRERGTATLFAEPSGDDYRSDVRVPLGKPLELPAPFSFVLDTAELA